MGRDPPVRARLSSEDLDELELAHIIYWPIIWAMSYGPQRRSQWIPENGCDFCECFALVLFIYFFPITGPVYLYLKLRKNKCCLGFREKHCHPCCHCGCDCSCDYCWCCQKDLVSNDKNYNCN